MASNQSFDSFGFLFGPSLVGANGFLKSQDVYLGTSGSHPEPPLVMPRVSLCVRNKLFWLRNPWIHDECVRWMVKWLYCVIIWVFENPIWKIVDCCLIFQHLKIEHRGLNQGSTSSSVRYFRDFFGPCPPFRWSTVSVRGSLVWIVLGWFRVVLNFGNLARRFVFG